MRCLFFAVVVEGVHFDTAAPFGSNSFIASDSIFTVVLPVNSGAVTALHLFQRIGGAEKVSSTSYTRDGRWSCR